MKDWPRHPRRIGMPFHGTVYGGVLTLPNGSTKTISTSAGQSVTLVRSPRAAAVVLTEEEAAQEAAQGHQWLTHAFLAGHTKRLGGSAECELGEFGWLFCTSNHTWRMRFEAAGDYSQTVNVYATEFGVFGRATAAEEYLAGTATFALKDYADVALPTQAVTYRHATHSQDGAISVINASGDYATFYQTTGHAGSLRIDLSENAGVVSAAITTIRSGSQLAVVVEEERDPYPAAYVAQQSYSDTEEEIENCESGTQSHIHYTQAEWVELELVVETEPNVYSPRLLRTTTTWSFGDYVTANGTVGNIWTKCATHVTNEPLGTVTESGGEVEWDTYTPCEGGDGTTVGGGCIRREWMIGSMHMSEKTWTSWTGFGWVYKETRQIEREFWYEDCFGEGGTTYSGDGTETVNFAAEYVDEVLKHTFDFVTQTEWTAEDYDGLFASQSIWPFRERSMQIVETYRATLAGTGTSNAVYGISKTLGGTTFDRWDGGGEFVVWNPLTGAVIRSDNPLLIV